MASPSSPHLRLLQPYRCHRRRRHAHRLASLFLPAPPLPSGQICRVGDASQESSSPAYAPNAALNTASSYPSPPTHARTHPNTQAHAHTHVPLTDLLTRRCNCAMEQVPGSYSADPRSPLCEHCPKGTYQGVAEATSCVACPQGATTRYEGSFDVAQCFCAAGYFDNASAPNGGGGSDGGSGRVAQCVRCPIGANCTMDSVTLVALPLFPGWYRPTSGSEDVHRCPDSAVGCNRTSICSRSNSGCRGGSNASNPCLAGLRGPFCRLCSQPEVRMP